MTTGRAIDHIGIAAHSLDGLAAAYQALGFTLTPRAAHPDHMGTSNRLVQFGPGAGRGRNFLELIEVDRPGGVTPLSEGVMSFGAHTQQFLTRREGINLIVFRTDDRDADLARWRAAGLDTYQPFDFQRLATLPDGSQREVRFELAFVTHPGIDVLFFVCDNKVEDQFWKPEFQRHENGAEEISAVTIASDAVDAHAGFLAALFGGAVSAVPGGQSVACGPHRIDVLQPDQGCIMDAPYTARPVGIEIRAPGLAGTCTPPQQAGGACITWTRAIPTTTIRREDT